MISRRRRNIRRIMRRRRRRRKSGGIGAGINTSKQQKYRRNRTLWGPQREPRDEPDTTFSGKSNGNTGAREIG